MDVVSAPRCDFGFSIFYVADETDDNVVRVAGDVVEECKTDSSRRSGDEVGRHVILIAVATLRVGMVRGSYDLED